MPFLVKLAIRNLWRNRRRTVLTFSVLALGIAWLIMVDSLAKGFTQASVQNIVNFETGELQIHALGYFEDRETLPLDQTLIAEAALAAVHSVEGVQAATPRVVTGARLNVGWEEFPVMAVAIDPTRDGEALDLGDYVEGRLPQEGEAEAVIGANLARLLDLQTNDVITLITRTREKSIQAIDLTIVGLARTPNPTVNETHVYLPLDTADAALAMEGGVTELVVRLEPGLSLDAGAERVRQTLEQAGVKAEVVTWRQSAAEFVALAQTSAASDMMLVAVILVISLVGVTNTILLGALERKREIGMMKAMGLREAEIVRLFLIEATGIGLLAVLTGSALGAGANLYLVEVGFDFSSVFGEIDMGLPITNIIHGVWNGPIFVWAGLAGIAACWIAGYLPARRAAKLDPATTMRA